LGSRHDGSRAGAKGQQGGAMDDKALKKVALFANLVPAQRALVAGIVEEVSVPPGTKICSDGDPADRFFFVIEGKVRISKHIPGVGEEALAILEPGDYFGEMALIDEAPRSADVIANTTVLLGAIDKQKFEDLLFMHKDLAYDLLWTLVRTLSTRLREANEKMRAFLAMAGKF
jgi:CRP-like cAMP-binding protein